MSEVVVTGGWGFVGSHLVEALLARGDRVTVLDPGGPPPDLAADAVRHVVGDVRDRELVAAAITPNVDTVYHLAAVVGVDQYLERPLDVIDITLTGTRTVLELSEKAGAKVLLTSTSEIFGKNPDVPWREDDDRVLGSTAVDRWSYSTSKALAEHLTFAFARSSGLRATIVRYFNVFGPRQRPAFVVSRSIHRALSGEPLARYDDGDQTRCFTYVEDAIAATLLAAESEKADGECFNIGSSVETTVGDVIDLVARVTGGRTEIVPVPTQERIGDGYQDLRRRVPDTTKIREVLGWRYDTPLEDGIARTVEWARRNPWWLAQSDSGST